MAAKVKGRKCQFCGASAPETTDDCAECGQAVAGDSKEIRPTKELREMIRRDIEQSLPQHMEGAAFELFDFHTDRYGYDNLGYCLAIRRGSTTAIDFYWTTYGRTFTKEDFSDLAKDVLDQARAKRRKKGI